ncbi:MAG: mucoidy inhibitor MuiA family protein [Deltaproteobacteria bacterium]|nr:mucoidy inhibitor MuiA family protein [Deltaproteobacteria bacterium]
MKTLRIQILTLFMITLCTTALGAPIKKAVIYQDMAYITIELKAKDHIVTLETPPGLIPESIIVAPQPGATIYNIRVERIRSVSGKVKLIQNKLIEKRSLKAEKQKALNMIEHEVEIIYKAAGAIKEDEIFPKDQVMDALAFIEHRVSKLSARQVKLSNEIKELDIQINDLEEQIRHISKHQGYQIVVGADGNIAISYAIKKAHWEPVYRISAFPQSKEINLEFSARVWQTTGMDWDTEEVCISTGRPSLGINAPVIRPWYIRPSPPVRALKTFESDTIQSLKAEAVSIPPGSVTSTTTSYLMGVGKKAKIPGDGTPTVINIQKTKIPARFTRVCIPKYDREVYLRAEGHWQGQAPILSGKYSAMVDGVFCGQGLLKRVEPGGKIKVDLGRDEGIKVERKEVTAFHEKTLTGKDKTSFSYKITIENTRTTPMDIIVKDQIPISQDERVKVAITEVSPVTIPDKDGILTWLVPLQPHEKKLLEFGFYITGMEINR